MNCSLRLLVLLLALFSLFASSPAIAAVAPRSDAELEADATIIVTGRVADFTVTDAAKGALEISLEVSAVKKGDAKAGETKIAMCIGCHGIPGYKTAYPDVYHVPMIAGQQPGYIVKALQ